MNKFDDMMQFLAATDDKFVQVIAVDRDFVLFSRAWCVAAIAEAFQSGMCQRLKLFSQTSLEKHEAKLRGLKIANMNASRPEDAKEILDKIPDKDAFNMHMQ